MYSYDVTNPGAVAMSNVTLTDDKCSKLSVPYGDTNGNNLLDTTESWFYACQMNLSATTTNTAIATGTANGLTVTDFSLATVVVSGTAKVTTSTPTLPNTGIGSDGDLPAGRQGNASWSSASVLLSFWNFLENICKQDLR